LQQFCFPRPQRTELKIHSDCHSADQRHQPNGEQPAQSKHTLSQTKTYSNLQVVNYYYEEHLIHLAHVQNLMITVFLAKNTSIFQAKDISSEVARAYEKLNAKIPDIRAHCC
jgi:hypothetical protein